MAAASRPKPRGSPRAANARKAAAASCIDAIEAWAHIARALATSNSAADRKLVVAIGRFMSDMPSMTLLREGHERRRADRNSPMSARSDGQPSRFIDPRGAQHEGSQPRSRSIADVSAV